MQVNSHGLENLGTWSLELAATITRASGGLAVLIRDSSLDCFAHLIPMLLQFTSIVEVVLFCASVRTGHETAYRRAIRAGADSLLLWQRVLHFDYR